MTKIYEQWCDRIEDERISHGHVLQLCHTVVPMAKGYAVHGRRTILRPDEARDVLSRLNTRITRGDGGPRAMPEKEQVGRTWLTRYWKRLGLPELDFQSIDEFRLCGFHEVGRSTWRGEEHVSLVPMWHASWRNGLWLNYAPGPWQGSLTPNSDKPRLRWDSNYQEVAA